MIIGNEFSNTFSESTRQGVLQILIFFATRRSKFKAFLDYALDLGANLIATGHYAKKGCKKAKWSLYTATDNSKDQSYFLYTLGQIQLAHTLFPLGDLVKHDVRLAAQEAGLPTYSKKDSTGICFIGERRFRNFFSAVYLR